MRNFIDMEMYTRDAINLRDRVPVENAENSLEEYIKKGMEIVKNLRILQPNFDKSINKLMDYVKEEHEGDNLTHEDLADMFALDPLKTLYLIGHPYYQFIGVIEEITENRILLKNIHWLEGYYITNNIIIYKNQADEGLLERLSSLKIGYIVIFKGSICKRPKTEDEYYIRLKYMATTQQYYTQSQILYNTRVQICDYLNNRYNLTDFNLTEINDDDKTVILNRLSNKIIGSDAFQDLPKSFHIFLIQNIFHCNTIKFKYNPVVINFSIPDEIVILMNSALSFLVNKCRFTNYLHIEYILSLVYMKFFKDLNEEKQDDILKRITVTKKQTRYLRLLSDMTEEIDEQTKHECSKLFDDEFIECIYVVSKLYCFSLIN